MARDIGNSVLVRLSFWHIHFMIAIAFGLTGLALPAQSDPAPEKTVIDGVFGTDNRRLVDSLDPPWNAVGRINIKGYRKRQHCTGTLIAPDKVVTAAHCLTEPQSGEAVSVDRIHFLAGVHQGDYLAHGRAACVHFLNPSKAVTSPRDDTAVVVLEKPLTIAPAPVLRKDETELGRRLIHAGYTRDRPHSLAADNTCQLRAADTGLWFSDCDTNFGASGGPVFVEQDNQLSLAAVMVGYAKGKYSIALPNTLWEDLARNANCRPPTK